MPRPLKSFSRLLASSGLLFASTLLAQAQGHQPTEKQVPDSSKVYDYVERMPRYPGGGDKATLTADLLREFRAASTASGCSFPAFPVYVNITVGPSGRIYDVMSLNNLPLITQAQAQSGVKGIVAKRPIWQRLPAACEAAIVAAAQKLPRFTPGTQNGRRVAVEMTLTLVGRTQ